MKYNPDVHHRHTIRLKDYDYSKKGMYFITVCTKDRKCILGEILNVGAPAHRCPEHTAKINLSEEGQIVEKYLSNINVVYKNIKLEEYVIMPNHLHLIINVVSGHLWAGAPTIDKPITIAKIINSLKTITSKQIGYSIWQRNYYEHIIRNEKELYRIVEYIKYNPLNWENDSNYKG